MRHQTTAIAFVLLTLAACSSRGEDRPAPGSNTVAGVVVDLTGAVTARRDADAAPRPLARGAELYADDTVTTAPDGAVRIEIRHNRAVIELGGGKSVRLCDSVAWKAPRGTGSGLLDRPVSDRTTVAGRHGEREAADTAATAMSADSKMPEDGYDKATAKASGEEGKMGRADPTAGLVSAPEVPLGGGATMTRFAVVSDGVVLPETAEPAIRAALAEALPGCYRAVVDAVPGTEGTLVLNLEIDAAGAIRTTATSFSPILDDCARAALAGLAIGAGRDAAGRPAAASVVIEIAFQAD